jgi:hypothetical protein
MLPPMRRLALLLILALATPAGAQNPNKGRMTVVEQPPAKTQALRGPQAPAEPAAAPAGMSPLPATRILATQAQGGDPGQCRAACGGFAAGRLEAP